MRKFAALLGIMTLLMMGCTEQETASPIQSDTTTTAQVNSVQPAIAKEEKSVVWIKNRLLEISGQYFDLREEAKKQGLSFEEFRGELNNIVSDNFIDQSGLEQFYKGGNDLSDLYLFHYEKGSFEARTNVLEQTPDRIVVKTMWFANELNSGYYEISTLVKYDDSWLLDSKVTEETDEKGFQLTIEEATTYMKHFPYYEKPVTSIKYVGKKAVENSTEYGQFYEFNCDGTAYYISPVDGYILGANMERF